MGKSESANNPSGVTLFSVRCDIIHQSRLRLLNVSNCNPSSFNHRGAPKFVEISVVGEMLRL